MFHRREGRIGIFATGAIHGIYCVGCCWALMLLLFSAGVMNLVWVALIACFIFAEKIAPAGGAVGRLAEFGMMAVGLVEMLQTGGLISDPGDARQPEPVRDATGRAKLDWRDGGSGRNP